MFLNYKEHLINEGSNNRPNEVSIKVEQNLTSKVNEVLISNATADSMVLITIDGLVDVIIQAKDKKGE